MPNVESRSERHVSLDLLQGLLLAGVALQNTLLFFHREVPVASDSNQLTDISTALFLTRWLSGMTVTAFAFLVGTTAFLARQNHPTKRGHSIHLAKVGAALIALDLTWMNWAGHGFAIQVHDLHGQLLWAVGWSLIALGGLTSLPISFVAVLAIAAIGLHNLVDWVPSDAASPPTWFASTLLTGADIRLGDIIVLHPDYPVLPWLGITTAGYAFGTIIQKPSSVRRQWLIRTGVNMIVAFFLLRFSNLYGDPSLWSSQPTGGRTLLSILNCSPNPPSLCHTLITLGLAALILTWLDWRKPPFLGPLASIGQMPLFFLLLQLPVIHGLAVAVNLIRFDRADWLYGAAPAKPHPDAGFDLSYVYLAWFIVLLLLYPVCQWLSDFTRRRKIKWLNCP